MIWQQIMQQCTRKPDECYSMAQSGIRSMFCAFKDCETVEQNYNAIIDIKSLKSILDKGWFIYLNPEANIKTAKQLQEHFDTDLRTFSLTGPFSVGKTFITNLLAGAEFATGDVVHTQGISIYTSNGVVFLDTAGSGNPVPLKKELIIERKLADFFIEEVVKHTSQGHIHVINRMNHGIEEKLIGLLEKGKKN